MLVAAAAMAFTSCQKEETAAPETVSATLTMHAGVEQTKTYLSGDNTVLWGKGESVSLYVGAGETAQFFNSASTDAYDGEESASFTFDIKDLAQADSYALGGIYPASAAIKDNKNASQFKVSLPATQNQVDGNYDPSAYIMVLKPEVVTELPDEYTASFRRAVALNKIILTGVKEDISSVEITVPEKKYLAGRRYMNLTTGESGEIYYDQSNKVTVNSSFTGNSIDVWFTSWGVELAEGDELSIKMTSATKTYTRTIVTRAEGIKFVEGDLNKLTVNMSTATEETLDNFSGDYLIVNTDLTRAAQAWAGGNNLPEFVLNARDGVVYESEGIENCKMTIEVQADGKYTVKDANGLYLYAASSSSNHLKGQEEASSWTIEQDGDKYILTSSAQTSRNIMQYNEQNKIFSCYSSGQKDITLYKYSDIKVDTTPSILVTSEHEQSIGADGGEVKFEYTLKNLSGQSLTVEETSDFVSASVAAGVVTATVSANTTTESRNATLTLKCGEAAPVSVTIIQAGKSAAGAVVDVLTCATTGVTATSYTDWSGKIVTSSAVYAGNSAKSNAGVIQLRSDKSSSGIVTTKSGGKVKKIKVTWNSSTSSGRTLDIYGKNTSYTAATELYSTSTQGTKLGSIKYGTSTELEISGDYEYIGLRSASGAMYLTEIDITWETSGSGGEVTPDPTPDPEPDQPEQGGSGEVVTETISGTFISANSKLALTTASGITIVQEKVSGSTAVNATYNTATTLRVYKGHALNFSGKTITKIEFTHTSDYKGNTVTASTGKYTSGATSSVWEGESDNITITNTATTSNVQLRPTKIVVTYKN